MNKLNIYKHLFLVLIGLLSWQMSIAATCTALTSGEWSVISWSCGRAPEAGDEIIIPAGITVTISSTVDLSTMSDATATTITIDGILLINAPNSCGGGACDIDLILDTPSEINVNSENGLQATGNGAGQQDIIFGTDEVLGANNLPFGPGSINALGVLPVELVVFHGFASDKSNLLSWQTATEENTSTFFIERSVDGKDDFEVIGRVEAVGNSTDPQFYEFEDQYPYTSNYYRLRIFDFDGYTEWSPLIFVERMGIDGIQIEVFPNPAVDQATILVHAENEQKAILQVFDQLGREIRDERVVLKAGVNAFELRPQGSDDKMYWFTLFDGKTRLVRSIVWSNMD